MIKQDEISAATIGLRRGVTMLCLGVAVCGWTTAGCGGETEEAAIAPAQTVALAEGVTPTDDYDKLLGEVVDGAGLVDYDGLIAERARLEGYIAYLGQVTPAELESMGRAGQMALYINAYNAITLARIIDNFPPNGSGLLWPKISIKNIKGAWDKTTNLVAGEKVTLNDIEHNVLRAKYKDARVHAAIVCASISCPNLAAEAYTAERLEEQLDRRARLFANDATKNTIDIAGKTVSLSKIFDWFKEDFESFKAEVPKVASGRGKAKTLAGGLGLLARYAEDEAVRAFLRAGDYKVKEAKYDWGLNVQ